MKKRKANTRILLLHIGDKEIQDHSRNKSKENRENVEEVSHDPPPHSRAAEHGSEETALSLGELLFALPLLLVNGIEMLRVQSLRARTHILWIQGPLSSGVDELREEGDAMGE